MKRLIVALALGAVAAAPAAAQEAPPGNAENGQRLFRQCMVCHTINEGGHAIIGPNLHGVVGRPMASAPGFNYSPAFRQRAAEIGTWTEDNLRHYLAEPQKIVPGTRMSFQGFHDNQQNLSDIIAFLKTQG